MSINIKKYTKDQMAKMVEDAQEKNAELEAKIAELKHRMNGEGINKANEIANLKADADVLRNKLEESEKELSEHRAATVRRLDELKKQLADTEAALRGANAEVSRYKSELRAARKEATDAQWAQIDEYRRADYAEAHPWRNLWAWVKRKLGRHE